MILVHPGGFWADLGVRYVPTGTGKADFVRVESFVFIWEKLKRQLPEHLVELRAQILIDITFRGPHWLNKFSARNSPACSRNKGGGGEGGGIPPPQRWDKIPGGPHGGKHQR